MHNEPRFTQVTGQLLAGMSGLIDEYDDHRMQLLRSQCRRPCMLGHMMGRTMGRMMGRTMGRISHGVLCSSGQG